MGEIAALVALTAVGLLLLVPTARRLPPIVVAALSFPLGASAFAVGAAVQVAVVERVDARWLLAGTLLVAGLIGGSSILRSGLPPAYLRMASGALVITAVLAWLFWSFHLTRLTIDSMRYLLGSVDLQLPSGITEVHPPDLIKRQLGLPAWHTLSEFTSRRYVAGLGPLFGVAGTMLLGWLVWSRTRRNRVLMTAGAIAFVLTSNRILFDWFYVNTHIEMAVLVLIAVVGLWLCVVEQEPAWAMPAGFSLATTLLLRAESPLLVGLVLIAFATWIPDRRARLWAATPSLVVTAVWHGWTLMRYAPDGTHVSLDAPVTVGMAVVVAAAALMILGRRPLTLTAERLALPGLTAMLLVYSVLDPDVLFETLRVTAVNVGYEGLWMLAWTVAIPLTVVALVVNRMPAARPWATFTVGFGFLYLLLPFGREAPYRLGAGDSGNRILAHAFLALVAFLVLVAAEDDEVEPGRVAPAR